MTDFWALTNTFFEIMKPFLLPTAIIAIVTFLYNRHCRKKDKAPKLICVKDTPQLPFLWKFHKYAPYRKKCRGALLTIDRRFFQKTECIEYDAEDAEIKETAKRIQENEMNDCVYSIIFDTALNIKGEHMFLRFVSLEYQNVGYPLIKIRPIGVDMIFKNKRKLFVAANPDAPIIHEFIDTNKKIKFDVSYIFDDDEYRVSDVNQNSADADIVVTMRNRKYMSDGNNFGVYLKKTIDSFEKIHFYAELTNVLGDKYYNRISIVAREHYYDSDTKIIRFKRIWKFITLNMLKKLHRRK